MTPQSRRRSGEPTRVQGTCDTSGEGKRHRTQSQRVKERQEDKGKRVARCAVGLIALSQQKERLKGMEGRAGRLAAPSGACLDAFHQRAVYPRSRFLPLHRMF